jgi:hypothetical protein
MGFLAAVGAFLGSGAATCALCGDPLGSRMLVDADGQRFCLRHGPEPLCRECGRLGGRPALDGAWLCKACEACGVREAPHARAILAQVRQDLQVLGFQLPASPIPVRLVQARELNPACDAREAPCEGRLLFRRRDDGTSEILGLSIQRGLPPVSCGRIIAHELGHAWLLREGYAELPPLKAEGLCELCAWLWMTSRERPRAPYKAEVMERNPDPVYGAGFRAARKVYRSGGLAALAPWLRGPGR